MREVPDFEEIFGIDLNDASLFKPRGSSLGSAVTGPEANRWAVVARIGDEDKRPTLALALDGDAMSWVGSADEASKITVFTDVREAHKAMFACRDLYPQMTLWVKGFTVKE